MQRLVVTRQAEEQLNALPPREAKTAREAIEAIGGPADVDQEKFLGSTAFGDTFRLRAGRVRVLVAVSSEAELVTVLGFALRPKESPYVPRRQPTAVEAEKLMSGSSGHRSLDDEFARLTSEVSALLS